MRQFPILLLSALAFSVVGCQSKNTTQLLQYTVQGVDSFFACDEKIAADLVEKQQDFMLLLYDDCGCGGIGEDTLSTFVDVIKQTEWLIYAIPSSLYKKIPLRQYNGLAPEKTFPTFLSSEAAKKAPYLYFYENGLLKESLTYKETLYRNVPDLKAAIHKRLQQQPIVLINDVQKKENGFYTFNDEGTAKLDAVRNGSGLVLFSWDACSDCTHLKNAVLRDYTKEKKSFPLYQYETRFYRSNYHPTNAPLVWENFAQTYGFSAYRKGKVPCFVEYSDGNVLSQFVYRNDVVELSDSQWSVTLSFHTEFLGQTASTKEKLQATLDRLHKEKLLTYLQRLGEVK